MRIDIIRVCIYTNLKCTGGKRILGRFIPTRCTKKLTNHDYKKKIKKIIRNIKETLLTNVEKQRKREKKKTKNPNRQSRGASAWIKITFPGVVLLAV